MEDAPNDPWWGDWFLAEVEGVLLRVVRDRGQVFADVGYNSGSPKLWQLDTVFRQMGRASELPPDDIVGLGRALERIWPKIRAAINQGEEKMTLEYGQPNGP
jgi:hypothetical protein